MKQFQKMIGYKIDELKNLTFKDFSHEGELDENIRLFEKLKNGEINNFST